jgi:uncharacterized protein with HEPN domain
VRRTD